jgi:mono/diheme cytochrome c family protein
MPYKPLFALLPLLLLGVTVAHAAQADSKKGARLAEQWCAHCHVIGNNSAGSIPQGPPSFRRIARDGMTDDQLRVFLSHPHGAMPDLELTRVEISDLIEYIETLR